MQNILIVHITHDIHADKMSQPQEIVKIGLKHEEFKRLDAARKRREWKLMRENETEQQADERRKNERIKKAQYRQRKKAQMSKSE